MAIVPAGIGQRPCSQRSPDIHDLLALATAFSEPSQLQIRLVVGPKGSQSQQTTRAQRKIATASPRVIYMAEATTGNDRTVVDLPRVVVF